MSLHNKKVKIKVDNFLEHRDMFSPMFMNFVEDNKDKIFIAKQEKKYKGSDVYTFKEDNRWLFYMADLEVIKSK